MIPEKLDFGFETNSHLIFSNYIGFLCLEQHSAEHHAELLSLFQSEELEGFPDALKLVKAFLSE